MQDAVDVTIIGAGVVGLAVAAEVAGEKRQVFVLERRETFGRETSSRHSGVIHAGIYYPPGSLKAELCVRGMEMLYSLCQSSSIGCKKLGKLVVASKKNETGELEVLLKRGNCNGAPALKLLSRDGIKKLEPNVEACAALHSPASGIIDSHALMKYLSGLACSKGTQTAYMTEVTSIDKTEAGYEVTVKDNEGEYSFTTRVLVNCAGLESHQVAEMAGMDIDAAGYRLHYCKGEYFSVGGAKNRMVSRLIFPVPPPAVTGVGIHVVLDLDGRLKLGPSIEYVDKIDYTVNSHNRQFFYDSIKDFLPFIDIDNLEPEMAGIRPKLQAQGEEIKDFIIRHEADRGLPGLINLIGIESPGLTAAPAIGEYVGAMVDEILKS